MRLTTQRIHQLLILLLAFSLPLDRRISPILIALLALNWLADLSWKEKIANLKLHKLALLPCLLYLLYCLGMLYTENIAFGLKDLETKLSLLLLPLIIASQPTMGRKEIEKIMHYFSLGCGLAVIICFAHSGYLYYDEIRQVENGTLHDTYTNVNFFFSSQLSYFMHPSYFAMYLCLSIAYLLYLTLNHHEPHSPTRLYLPTATAIVFTLFVAFLASRMGMIILTLTWLWWLTYIVVKKKYYKAGIASFLALVIASILLYKNSQIIASRIDLTLSTLTSQKLNRSSSESSTARALIWEQAIIIIADNFLLGVGTGDIKDVLLKKYEETGLTGALEHKLNAHNQFFQTAIALGLPGFLMIISIAITPLLIQKHRSNLLLFFFICISLNFSVESMLEIQAGTVFFSFFNSIILTFNKEKLA